MATTLPMKNPTAKLLWNLRIIMVPPMLRNRSIMADHSAAKPSDMLRVDITTSDMSIKMPVKLKMEYLKNVEDEE